MMREQIRPFDLSKLDFEGRRYRRRRRLLLWSLPVAIPAALLSLKILSIPLLSSIAHSNYVQGRYDASLQALAPLYFGNWMESYKLPFNSGVALYRKAAYQDAEASFRKSLETAPKQLECHVRINLALSIEAQADALRGQRDYDKAIIKYGEMKSVIVDGEEACGITITHSSVAREDSEDAASLEKRADEKAAEAKQQRNNDTPEAVQKNDKAGDKSSEDKLRQLEKNATNQQNESLRGARQRQQYRAQEQHGYGNWKDKKW